MELIEKLLTYDPDERPTARQALKMSYFRDLREQDEMMRKIARVPRGFDSKSPSKSDDGSVVGSVGAEKGAKKEHSPGNTLLADDDDQRLPPLKKPYKLHPIFQDKGRGGGKKHLGPGGKKGQAGGGGGGGGGGGKKPTAVSYLSPYSHKAPKKDASLIASLPSHSMKL